MPAFPICRQALLAPAPAGTCPPGSPADRAARRQSPGAAAAAAPLPLLATLHRALSFILAQISRGSGGWPPAALRRPSTDRPARPLPFAAAPRPIRAVPALPRAPLPRAPRPAASKDQSA